MLWFRVWGLGFSVSGLGFRGTTKGYKEGPRRTLNLIPLHDPHFYLT